MSATAAYYFMDSVLRDESAAGYLGEARYWWLASLTLGPFLGAVGAVLVRSGMIGLLAMLIVPVGALVQTLFLQPGLASNSRPAALWALVIISAAAVATISLGITRFALQRRDPATPTSLQRQSSNWASARKCPRSGPRIRASGHRRRRRVPERTRGAEARNASDASQHDPRDRARGQQVISYRAPAFRVGGKTVAGFAAFRDHLSYLPFSGSPQLAHELEGYTMTKSALHFAVDQPLPETLVKKLIAVRLAENR